MPRTIEHKIKLIGSTTPSTNISEYGSIERQKNLSNFDNKISQSKGTGSHVGSANIKADEISYGTESFERRLHYSPNEIEREQFSCRKFGERCCLGGDGDSKVKFQDNYKTTAEAIHPINHKYDNSDPFTHPMHKDEEWDVFEGDDDISIKNGTKGSERGLPRQSPSKQLENKPIKIKNSKNEKTSKFIQNNPKNNQFYQNNYFPNNIQSPPTMKRVIKKSRLVSIYDGRPMSDFVETVHYEPVENNYC
uniref:Uncharacterized protein n=1 Tax=Meloidogyne hapla TaxID=6305 RepID=A0A1I8BGZ0_MELHA